MIVQKLGVGATSSMAVLMDGSIDGFIFGYVSTTNGDPIADHTGFEKPDPPSY